MRAWRAVGVFELGILGLGAKRGIRDNTKRTRDASIVVL